MADVHSSFHSFGFDLVELYRGVRMIFMTFSINFIRYTLPGAFALFLQDNTDALLEMIKLAMYFKRRTDGRFYKSLYISGNFIFVAFAMAWWDKKERKILATWILGWYSVCIGILASCFMLLCTEASIWDLKMENSCLCWELCWFLSMEWTFIGLTWVKNHKSTAFCLQFEVYHPHGLASRIYWWRSGG